MEKNKVLEESKVIIFHESRVRECKSIKGQDLIERFRGSKMINGRMSC